MSFIRKHISTYWPYYVLGLVQILLFAINYKPQTYLVGWDNLFPEFDFGLNIKRSLFAVWQEYRGMGVVDNMSHASTLVEDIERFILSLFLHQHLIRWVYLMALHLVGGLGMYHLLTTSIFSLSKKTNKIWYILASLIAALFYQHNLGTIQQMFLPMEVFVVHFAYLPWLVWAALQIFSEGKRQNYIIFGILSLLATPQAHVPTLFIVYTMALAIVLGTNLIYNITAWKRALLIVVITFVTNAFWFLPFVYATINHSEVVANSKAFRMASEDIFYRNHEYGDIQNIALIKGTLLQYNYYDFANKEYHLMFEPWLTHLATPLFQIPAWIFFIFAVIGLLVSFTTYKRASAIGTLFIFAIFMLGTNIPIIGSLNEYLREHIPLFRTVFRFVFTKFSILYVFSFSILIGIGIAQMGKYIRLVTYKATYYAIIAAVIILYILPSFQGHFLYKNLKVQIPQQYFQTFEFFNSQNPNTRVAMLPTPWYWAWLQPDWGTINSGFLWYAVPQATTDLAFTPWSRENENFYWELDKALTVQSAYTFEAVLEKYDVNWIYLDTSIINSESRKFTYDEIKTLLSSSQKIKLAEQFDKILIYQFIGNNDTKDFVGIKSALPSLAYSQEYDDFDLYYLINGDYRKKVSNEVADSIYPYFSLFSGKAPAVQNLSIEDTGTQLTIVGTTDQVSEQPVLNDTVSTTPSILDITNGHGEIVTLEPKYSLDLNQSTNGEYLVKFNIDKSSALVYDSNKDPWYRNQTNEFCEIDPQGKTRLRRLEEDTVSFTLESINAQNCLRVPLLGLSHRYGYLVKITYTADSKRGWLVNFYNETAQKSSLETYLQNNGKQNVDYFILSPDEAFGQGYTIYFNNKSEGIEKIVNTLHGVEVYQIPYEQIKNIHIANKDISQLYYEFAGQQLEVSHPNPVRYEVITNTNLETSQNDRYLYLSQSFNHGWKAYKISCQDSSFGCRISKFLPFIFGEELKNHVLVNNWANGWKIDNNTFRKCTVIIYFLPNILQYIGFTILLITSLIIGSTLLRRR